MPWNCFPLGSEGEASTWGKLKVTTFSLCHLWIVSSGLILQACWSSEPWAHLCVEAMVTGTLAMGELKGKPSAGPHHPLTEPVCSVTVMVASSFWRRRKYGHGCVSSLMGVHSWLAPNFSVISRAAVCIEWLGTPFLNYIFRNYPVLQIILFHWWNQDEVWKYDWASVHRDQYLHFQTLQTLDTKLSCVPSLLMWSQP